MLCYLLVWSNKVSVNSEILFILFENVFLFSEIITFVESFFFINWYFLFHFQFKGLTKKNGEAASLYGFVSYYFYIVKIWAIVCWTRFLIREAVAWIYWCYIVLHSCSHFQCPCCQSGMYVDIVRLLGYRRYFLAVTRVYITQLLALKLKIAIKWYQRNCRMFFFHALRWKIINFKTH